MHFSISSAGMAYVHQWNTFLDTGMTWPTNLVVSKVHYLLCRKVIVCIRHCIFCCVQPDACAVLTRPNGLSPGVESEISCACSCHECTCSGLSPSGRSELLFGAAPPCISLFDSVSDCVGCIPFGLHGFDASAFTSFRTSYRLLGWVTFVHHSVGKHVRLLLALGYDSLEYFIFYIHLNTLGLVTYFDQYSIFTFILRKLESTRTRTSGQTVYVNLHLCLALARPVCLKLGTCISRLLHAFHFMHFCTILLVHVSCICGMLFMNMCRAAVQDSTSAAVLLSAFRF